MLYSFLSYFYSDIFIPEKVDLSLSKTGELYHCDQCLQKFTRVNNLKKHIKIRHLGVRFDCDQCEFTTSEHFLLRNHKAEWPLNASNAVGCFLFCFVFFCAFPRKSLGYKRLLLITFSFSPLKHIALLKLKNNLCLPFLDDFNTSRARTRLTTAR